MHAVPMGWDAAHTGNLATQGPEGGERAAASGRRLGAGGLRLRQPRGRHHRGRRRDHARRGIFLPVPGVINFAAWGPVRLSTEITVRDMNRDAVASSGRAEAAGDALA